MLKTLEEARTKKLIGNSLGAKVIIFYSSASKKIALILEKYLPQLPSIFIVSDVELKTGIDTEDVPVYNIKLLKESTEIESGQIKIKVQRAEGEKCIRCWNYSLSVGKSQAHPKICTRCIDDLSL